MVDQRFGMTAPEAVDGQVGNEPVESNMAAASKGGGENMAAMWDETMVVSDKILRMREIRRRVELVQNSLKSAATTAKEPAVAEAQEQGPPREEQGAPSLWRGSEHGLMCRREEVHQEHVSQKLMPRKSGSAILERLNSLQREMVALRTSTQATRTLLQLRMDMDGIVGGTSETLQEQSNRIKSLIESHMSDIETKEEAGWMDSRKADGVNEGETEAAKSRSEFVRQVANDNFSIMYGKNMRLEMSSAVQSIVLSEIDGHNRAEDLISESRKRETDSRSDGGGWEPEGSYFPVLPEEGQDFDTMHTKQVFELSRNVGLRIARTISQADAAHKNRIKEISALQQRRAAILLEMAEKYMHEDVKMGVESSSSDETEYVEDEDQEPFRKEERDFNIILSASKAQQKY
ncbi:hypothetical protein GUITHDRAFT_109580 [Guillardia theta CCMP2712]|uniref:Uncharacterized protein n=1 Tax=Guillardia theta (strain CCMP2712) TaxID=905079 RepID=L1J802_GUITC|nr:hypothetical protein GUITHDRAFT_109580 [Guillardia theta CCMP2712]EKX44457.1 hypothetical protein GUITHDRAFT_109580 [Guillardia theta CCMP2712]|eukprot:XP_005831437.1 hypothetical protein GUITHDRAFT_109580 [Guillardia theta CCMP2712]